MARKSIIKPRTGLELLEQRIAKKAGRVAKVKFQKQDASECDLTSKTSGQPSSSSAPSSSPSPEPQPSLSPSLEDSPSSDASSSPQLPASSEDSAASQLPTTPPAKHPEDRRPKGASGNPYLDFVVRYREDPEGLVRNVFGIEPDEWQCRFLKLAATGQRRISIRAGHGVGKSSACSWLIIHHLLTKFPQKVVATAPTAPQLYDALFAEVKFWINRLPPFIKDLFDITSDRIVLKSAPEASFVSARTSSKEKPEALAGVHSEHVLLVVDEASAVDEAVFESAAGSMSGHNATTILIGNPTRSSGMFYKTHHELASDWATMHVSCVDSPRVTPDFIKQIRDTYGENSNAYRVRVLGDFPTADDDTLISADIVDAAIARDIATDPKAPVLFGVDVARYGDDQSCLCIRQGDVVLGFKTWRNLDLMSLCGAIVNEASQYDPAEICVDSIGLGAGLADRLRELGLPCRDVNVSEVAALNQKANRLRDELWMSVRDWLAARACKLPDDNMLRADLITPKYSFTSSGKLVVEPKAEMKKRIRRSPDMADALCLTFAGQGAMLGGRMAAWRPGKPILRRVSIC